MSAIAPDLMRFHLLRRPIEADQPGTSELLPALLTPYRDLSSLRYDYPLVLTEDPPYVHSLTDVVNRSLQAVAPPGVAGERLRQHVLRLEGALRRLVVRGRQGSLTKLWKLAARDLLSASDEAGADALKASLEQAERALPVNGAVVDCDGELALHLLKHVWQAKQQQASHRVGKRIDELILRLTGILKADFLRSDDGRSPANLSASLGGDHRSAFDFESWSDILSTGPAAGTISEARRRRIQSALSVLRAQRFFAMAAGESTNPKGLYSFLFGSCVVAAETFRKRVPAIVELVKAMAIAELEIDNRYQEADHDPFFREFGESSLTPADMDLFPSYLVFLSDRDLVADEKALLIDILGSDAPIKVLVQIGDILGEPPSTNGRARPTVVGRQLGRMAMGLGTAYVVQSTSSNLYRMTDRIGDGIAFSGPALFSVFTGSAEDISNLPSYLIAAAAIQSRAFPAFSYDPGAGSDWAERFRIELNPQTEAAWPSELLSYEDAELQRSSETIAFTFVDFAALDRRYNGHFATAPPESWSDDMEPAAHQIDLDEGAVNGKVPYILMATGDSVLQRVVVDRELIRAARRSRETWHSLQELAGIHNSHAEALLEIERAKWEEQKARELEQLKSPVTPATEVITEEDEEAGTEPLSPIEEPAEEQPRGDEPFIETARCTTCDECTELNPRMFAYDENKQAYIADLAAGTYREMVRAAEVCQVAIIHPGKPWNPAEPGLDDLIARAAEFN